MASHESRVAASGKWVRCTTETWLDEAGTPAKLMIAVQDITESKAAEQRRVELEAQLFQAQKMEALGQLTGGVAHDFNNLLMVILGNLELLEDRIGDDAKSRRLIAAAAEAGRAGSDLNQRLLAFSRRQALEPEIVDVNQRLERFIPLVARSLGEAIEVRQRLAPTVWPVSIDPGQFDNAVLNLAVNARDAMSKGGRIEIVTENVIVDAAYAAQVDGLRPGDHVRVSVADTGCGMPPEILARAFEPFFTTKELGKGTGLGLSMVYGFIKQSGGNITIYSEVGKGTVVRLLLPRAAQAGVAASPAAQAAVMGGETVLAVEDDPRVRAVTVAFLDSLGYHVLEAADQQAALAVLGDHREIALLLTDVVLAGGENGVDLAGEAARRHPSLKVLFASGYNEEMLERNGNIKAGMLLLRKPFTKAALSLKVREALGGKPYPRQGANR